MHVILPFLWWARNKKKQKRNEQKTEKQIEKRERIPNNSKKKIAAVTGSSECVY